MGRRMAGIYLRHDIFDEPEVLRTADALGVPPLQVVGCFARIWSWADRHLRDLVHGQTGLPPGFFDHMVSHDRFILTAAERAPHWVMIDDAGVRLMNLEKHNGKGAKERRDAVVRKQNQRDRERGAGHRSPRPPKARPARRVPNDFLLTPDRRIFARTAGLSDERVEHEWGKFRDWEFAKGKTDWDATWRNWVRTAVERNGADNDMPSFAHRETDGAQCQLGCYHEFKKSYLETTKRRDRPCPDAAKVSA
jgi:hypothetical protein